MDHRHLHPLEPRRLFAATLSLSSPHVSESDKFATFHVTLSAPSGKPVTLAYATRSGTAVAGRDFKPTTGRLTLPAGATSANIKIPLVNDNHIEPTETFRLSLSAAGATPLKPFATATITDDEPLPVFSISSRTVVEGTGRKHARTATLTVRLATPIGKRLPSDIPVTVRYRTAGLAGYFGGATPNADFTPVHGTLTFAPNETKKTIQIPIRPDPLGEGPERFTVILSKPTGGTLAPYTLATPDDPTPRRSFGTVYITDDDPAPTPPDTTLPTLHNDLAEADPKGGPYAFVSLTSPDDIPDGALPLAISLSAPSDHDVTVDYAYPAPGTLAPSVVPASGTLTIPAGQTTANIWVAVILDPALTDPSGAYLSDLSIRLSNPTNAILPNNGPSLLYSVPIVFTKPDFTTPSSNTQHVTPLNDVNNPDYLLINRANAQQPLTLSPESLGDFNYDGVVDDADSLLLDRSFAQ